MIGPLPQELQLMQRNLFNGSSVVNLYASEGIHSHNGYQMMYCIVIGITLGALVFLHDTQTY